MVLTPRTAIIGMEALAMVEVLVALANNEKVLFDKVAFEVANLAIRMELVLKDIVKIINRLLSVKSISNRRKSE